jgi:hypothetical protein
VIGDAFYTGFLGFLGNKMLKEETGYKENCTAPILSLLRLEKLPPIKK